MNTLTISTRLKSQLFTLVQGIFTLALTLLGLLVITFTPVSYTHLRAHET